MKYVLLSALCLAFSGCANTSNGGGWVVSNGMTDSGTAQDGMNTFGAGPESGIGKPDVDCSCGDDAKSCDCAPIKKKKRKH